MICQRNPDLGRVREIFADWKEILQPISATINMLPGLQEAGYRLYVLSNFHLRPFKMFSGEDFFRYFTGKVISAQVNALKPEPEIYRYLLKKFALVPGETVFIDDLEENLRGARAFGIKTILFEDPSRLKEQLPALGIMPESRTEQPDRSEQIDQPE